MPSCGSQCYLCDLPIRFDTYAGCSHACNYCFVQRRNSSLNEVKPAETTIALRRFISGQRDLTTCWADWDIPLHWGGMSDPFQPCEATHRLSYECLKVFAETRYPFIVSTKGKLIAEPEYLELISKCNRVVQISMVCPSYDRIERGCPSFEERLRILKKVSAVAKRTIVRIQPYMHEKFSEIMSVLPRLKEAGAYGIIVEGMKFVKKKPGLVKVNGDWCYPVQVLRADFEMIKAAAHKIGLAFFCGENRLRRLGDSLTCCGTDGLPGFKPNTYNLNHILNGDSECKPTEAMKKPGSAYCWKVLFSRAGITPWVKSMSFEGMMSYYAKSRPKTVGACFGLDSREA